jgi:CRP/FNR family transcriptional regulator
MNVNYDRFNYFSPISIDETVWQEMLGLGYPKSFAEGTQLFAQNQPVSNLIFLTKGIVKTVHIYPNGNERLFEILEAPSIIGHEALFFSDMVLNPNIIALPPIETTIIPLDKAETLILSKPEVLVNFYKILRNSLFLSRIQSAGVMYMSLLQRTAFALQLMCFSKTDERGFFTITHQDLANFIGISRANVTICLTQLANMNLIEKNAVRSRSWISTPSSSWSAGILNWILKYIMGNTAPGSVSSTPIPELFI